MYVYYYYFVDGVGSLMYQFSPTLLRRYESHLIEPRIVDNYEAQS
jgi:hypothetical protein